MTTVIVNFVAKPGQRDAPTTILSKASRMFWFIAPGGLQLAVWESPPKG